MSRDTKTTTNIRNPVWSNLDIVPRISGQLPAPIVNGRGDSRWKRKELFADGWTDVRTFETHFIRSTQNSWPKNLDAVAQPQTFSSWMVPKPFLNSKAFIAKWHSQTLSFKSVIDKKCGTLSPCTKGGKIWHWGVDLPGEKLQTAPK